MYYTGQGLMTFIVVTSFVALFGIWKIVELILWLNDHLHLVWR